MYVVSRPKFVYVMLTFDAIEAWLTILAQIVRARYFIL